MSSSNPPSPLPLSLSPSSLSPPFLPCFHRPVSFITAYLNCLFLLSRASAFSAPMWHQHHWTSCALWFIISDILALLHHACYVPLALVLSTFLTHIWPSYSTSLLYLGTSLLDPVLSTLIFLIHSDLPRFSTFAFTPLHSNPIWSLSSALYSQLWLLHSFYYIIAPLFTALIDWIGSDRIGLDQLNLAQ